MADETPKEMVERIAAQRAAGTKRAPRKSARGEAPSAISALPELKERALASLRDGTTYQRAAASIGRDASTLRLWRCDDAVFRAACEAAVAEARTAKIEETKVEALDGLKALIADRNPAGVIFACKALLGMRETDRHEMVGANGGSIRYEQVKERTDSDLQREVDAIFEAASERADARGE